MPRCVLESPREMRRAHVHERGEMLDLDVLRDVLAYEVLHDTQLWLRETRTRIAPIGVVSVPER